MGALIHEFFYSTKFIKHTYYMLTVVLGAAIYPSSLYSHGS